jgi:hypothetical protein
MIVSTNRPYFAPFSGFFLKAISSDILVLLDSVQFPQGTTWLNRNRFKSHQGTLWITIPVWKKGLGLQKINEVRVCHEGQWSKKHLTSLKNAYKKAPFFEDHIIFLKNLFSEEPEKLLTLNLKIIYYLFDKLGIYTKILLLSELDIDTNEPQLSLDICRKVGASHFLVQKAARKSLSEEVYRKRQIEVIFLNPKPPVYPQLWGPFSPNLSALDLLFNCGPKGYDILNRSLSFAPITV